MHHGCQHLKSRRTKVAGNSSGLPQLPATNHHQQLARSSTPNPRTQPPSPPHIRPRPKSTPARTHALTVAKTSHYTCSVPGPLPSVSVSVCLCLSLSLSVSLCLSHRFHLSLCLSHPRPCIRPCAHCHHLPWRTIGPASAGCTCHGCGRPGPRRHQGRRVADCAEDHQHFVRLRRFWRLGISGRPHGVVGKAGHGTRRFACGGAPTRSSQRQRTRRAKHSSRGPRTQCRSVLATRAS